MRYFATYQFSRAIPVSRGRFLEFEYTICVRATALRPAECSLPALFHTKLLLRIN